MSPEKSHSLRQRPIPSVRSTTSARSPSRTYSATPLLVDLARRPRSVAVRDAGQQPFAGVVVAAGRAAAARRSVLDSSGTGVSARPSSAITTCVSSQRSRRRRRTAPGSRATRRRSARTARCQSSSSKPFVAARSQRLASSDRTASCSSFSSAARTRSRCSRCVPHAFDERAHLRQPQREVVLGGVADRAVHLQRRCARRGRPRRRTPPSRPRRRGWSSTRPSSAAPNSSGRANSSPTMHVGEQVLHRLEAADRLAELRALLGVLDRSLEQRAPRPRAAARLLRACRGRVRAPRRPRRSVRQRSPRRGVGSGRGTSTAVGHRRGRERGAVEQVDRVADIGVERVRHRAAVRRSWPSQLSSCTPERRQYRRPTRRTGRALPNRPSCSNASTRSTGVAPDSGSPSDSTPCSASRVHSLRPGAAVAGRPRPRNTPARPTLRADRRATPRTRAARRQATNLIAAVPAVFRRPRCAGSRSSLRRSVRRARTGSRPSSRRRPRHARLAHRARSRAGRRRAATRTACRSLDSAPSSPPSARRVTVAQVCSS